MININSYIVTENSVVSGVTSGVEALLKDVNNFSKPEVVINTIASSVMDELCNVFDFGDQPLRFTPDLMRKILQLAKEQEKEEKA
jgi:hypothetical protein